LLENLELFLGRGPLGYEELERSLCVLDQLGGNLRVVPLRNLVLFIEQLDQLIAVVGAK
jgi:hypothetical protein